MGYAARFHTGYDLIVISLVDWEVGNEKFKIKSTLGCGQVQFKTLSPSCSIKRDALIYRGPNVLVLVLVLLLIPLKI